MTEKKFDPQDAAKPRLTGMLARVLGPVGPEVTCEQCFELLDQYVDRELPTATRTTNCPACERTSKAARRVARTTTAFATS